MPARRNREDKARSIPQRGAPCEPTPADHDERAPRLPETTRRVAATLDSWERKGGAAISVLWVPRGPDQMNPIVRLEGTRADSDHAWKFNISVNELRRLRAALLRAEEIALTEGGFYAGGFI